MIRLSQLLIVALILLLFGIPFTENTSQAGQGRRTESFDRDWKFHLGDVPGGERPDLDVSSGWRSLDVPHDWSIEGPFDPHSPGRHDTGYLDGGIGWYRKTFSLPETDRQQRVFLQFDGVYMDSDAWINGHHLGNHPYGYTSFQYDLTPHLHHGKTANVLAVRVHVQQPCSRWYSGAGIYRHVWLTLTDPIHVDHWGTYVTTPDVAGHKARVRVRTRVRNESTTGSAVTLRTVIVDPHGKEVARGEATQRIDTGGGHQFDQTLEVGDVRRWSLEDPCLYRAVSEVRVGDRTADTCTTPFGIRTIRFSAGQGFFLNDRHVPLKGVCNHHDLGCLGAAVYRRGIERQLEVLKRMGCNAIRTSHNPPAPELLDLCDRMGFVVMDEAFDEWRQSKTRFGYGRFFDRWSERDLVSMLHRDRNHPCIILWSIGNEIPEQTVKAGAEISRRLTDICHREDPTRPVTSACHHPLLALATGFAKPLDVFGINYNIAVYQTVRGKNLVASETASALSTRGEYNLVRQGNKVEVRPEFQHQCTSYDLAHPPWGHAAETSLKALRDSPWIAGEFVWTGFDYIGEPTPYTWPSRSSYFGIVDLCGFPKDRYYLYQSRWTDRPMVHLLPHWNWEGLEGKAIPVWCFTNAESVELSLNGRSLGTRDWKDARDLHLEWSVPYAPGVLKAVARKGGKVVATHEVHTAGKPAKLVLHPDRNRIRSDGRDLSYVEVCILDRDGHPCPNADHQVAFTVSGPGLIAGVDNGDPTNHESFKGRTHKAFHGKALAVIQSTRKEGEIHLRATAEGLESARTTIAVGAAEQK